MVVRFGEDAAGRLFLRALLYDPPQLTGTTGPDGTLYQGTETGVLRVTSG